MAYETTDVSVSRSQEQIRAVLAKHGADSFSTRESFGKEPAAVGLEFVYHDTLVRMWAELKEPSEKEIADKARRSRSKRSVDEYRRDALEQEAKRIWRVVHWAIKVRMEAIAERLETFEQAFLPHIVDPASNRTLWEMVRPAVETGALQHGGGGLKALGAGK